MSQLEQYNADDLHGLGTNQMPGAWVRHKEDEQSFGMVISKVGDQTLVLWSRQPHLIKIQSHEIKTTVRKLKTRWATHETPTNFVGDFKLFNAELEIKLGVKS